MILSSARSVKNGKSRVVGGIKGRVREKEKSNAISLQNYQVKKIMMISQQCLCLLVQIMWDFTYLLILIAVVHVRNLPQ